MRRVGETPHPPQPAGTARHYVPSIGSWEGQTSLPLQPRRATAVIGF